jgi:hypothetical protein
VLVCGRHTSENTGGSAIGADAVFNVDAAASTWHPRYSSSFLDTLAMARLRRAERSRFCQGVTCTWADVVYLQARMEESAECMLVVFGARASSARFPAPRSGKAVDVRTCGDDRQAHGVQAISAAAKTSGGLISARCCLGMTPPGHGLLLCWVAWDPGTGRAGQ